MSSNYWQNRMARAQTALTNKNIRQIEKQITKYYLSAMEQTIADFEAVYNKILIQQSEGKEVTPALLYRLDAYWQAQAQLTQRLEKLRNRQARILSEAFQLQFFDVYYSIAIPGKEAFATIDADMAQQLINQIWVLDGKSWSDRIWENTQQLAATLNEELIHCVTTGKKTTDLKKRLQERFGVSYSRADALVRTELAHIQTQAAKQRYEDYGIQYVEVLADPDERRCDICGDLHQKRFPVDAQIPVPAHPRCRCCIVPVVEIE